MPAETAVPSTAPASQSTSTVPKDGGTLVEAIPGDIGRTDPSMSASGNDLYVSQNVMEGLVALAPGSTSKVVGRLATGWTTSPDGLTYTFTLRQGVKFHDGTPFDAAAVKFNYDRWTNAPGPLQEYLWSYSNVFGGFGADSNLASVDVVDPSTVALHLKNPQSNFLVTQTLPDFSLASPEALKAGGGDNTVTDISKIEFAQGGPHAMVGTGPFKFKEWVPGDHVTIVKNADYWGTKAHLDAVVFKPISDTTQVLNALRTGEIELAQTVAPIDVATVKSTPNLQVFNRGEACSVFDLSTNQKYKPLDNLKIRLAMAYAVNKQSYVGTFYGGLAVPADNWMPLNTQYAKPLNLPTYDPAKARSLIAESGVTDLTIDFWYPSGVTRQYMPDPKGLFEAISRDLQAVGFKVNAHTEAWSPNYIDDYTAGKFPVFVSGWNCDWSGADNFLYTAYFGYMEGKPAEGFAYRNDQLQETMQQAMAATDEGTAAALWGKAQDMLKADQPTIPLVNAAAPAAAQSYVKGFVPSGALNEALDTVWLDK
jgi:peptide/nickel transport system substrate-binding protein